MSKGIRTFGQEERVEREPLISRSPDLFWWKFVPEPLLLDHQERQDPESDPTHEGSVAGTSKDPLETLSSNSLGKS